MIDLGAWFSGEHAIPADEEPGLEFPDAERD